MTAEQVEKLVELITPEETHKIATELELIKKQNGYSGFSKWVMTEVKRIYVLSKIYN